MSNGQTSFENMINGIFRPVIGFFIGLALGYTTQLAGSAGWVFAIGFASFVAVLFGAVVLLDVGLGRLFDKAFGGIGVKAPRNQVASEKPHWWVRFGWITGLVAGYAAVFLAPQSLLDRLI